MAYSIHFSLYDQQQPSTTFDDLFQRLPDNALAGQHAQLLAHHPKQVSLPAPIDNRFGPIQIDWADRTTMSANPPAASGSQTQTPKKKRIFHSAKPQVSAPVGKFQQTDSFKVEERSKKASDGESFQGMEIGAAQVSFGIVHLYKDKQEAASGTTSPPTDNQLSPDDVGSIVAVLAVPSYLTSSDFLSFVEPASEAVCHLRLVRDMHPNRCMVLIKFRDSSDAEDFYKMFNGQPFNAMDPEEVCQVVYVTDVTVSKHSTLPLTYPTLSNSDPWPLRPKEGYELPTCPVCLERMDSSVTGLMTITCQHTFHCSCLSKWSEGRCPVCRYSQTGSRASRSRRPGASELVDQHPDEEDEEAVPSTCAICETGQDLWVCLICASVGCGRYKAGHAHRHFDETGHLYSLELETQRVWDYAGDGYVHRLIQNKADGKLVELPSASSAAATPERSRRLPHEPAQGSGSQQPSQPSQADDPFGPTPASSTASEKIEAIGLEYSYLLTSQLESQRHFYEEKMDALKQQLDTLTTKLPRLEAAAEEREAVSSRAAQLQAEKEEVERQRVKAEKRADKMMELARRLEREMQTERSMSQGLMTKLDKQRQSETELRTEVEDLREQVKDLMFFVQAREQVDRQGGEELRGGGLEVKPAKRKGKKK